MNHYSSKSLLLICLCFLTGLLLVGCARKEPQEDRPPNYVGSSSCRECHKRFYELWAPSHHGKAMQPVTSEFVDAELVLHTNTIQIGENRYRARIEKMDVIEVTPDGTNVYPMVHAMGGKNVYFFLTPLDRGRLQVMPISFNVPEKRWFDTTLSMVRHFAEEDREDEAIGWRDPLLTFNAACYGCHVSQMKKNYDAETDTYHTEWREPGINCEACHGPGEDHIRVCRAAPEGVPPENLELLSWRDLTREQKNDACSVCHAKMRPLTPSFTPGERFFDHYGLVCLEDADFYADGRDLGENYTLTGWMMNACVRAGTMDCIHCHTSSGRYRFAKENPNGACLPCHAKRVASPETHTHHAPPPKGPKCISCHMPLTSFAQMRRSDHSMRPPSPEATLAFGSPNACALCHKDKKTEWLAEKVKKWHPENRWTKRILHEGRLFDEARREKWERLDEMLAYMLDPATGSVEATSFIRVLINCSDARKWTAIKQCLKNESPLVRSAAVDALRDALDLPTVLLVSEALSDEYRLVRISAASALSQWPRERLTAEQRKKLELAEQELFVSFDATPDHWSSHYNRGNYFGDRGDMAMALASYERSIRLRGDMLPPYVNASVTAARLGRMNDSIRFLRSAHKLEPDNAGVNFNLGLALAERGDVKAAEKHLRTALKDESTKGQAAYNLAVIVGADDPERAARLSRIAADSQPHNPRNAYTLAYYLIESNQGDRALAVLEKLVQEHPGYVDAWMLLIGRYRASGRKADAVTMLKRMAETDVLSEEVRMRARNQLKMIQSDSH
ncbi:MAG: ammonia-forming cytochrome c nitrite reductase subunit c552 [Kiritimatiellae bacterium]|nr:ammonia-forming cytochrome c nitrite reductase subunit c552 [Kiritimatiellia bacterium]